VIEKAFQSLAKPYDYFLLFAFPFFTDKMATGRATNGAFICSENVAWCYHEAGIDLTGKGTPTAMEAPADIAASKKLNWLGFYDHTNKVSDGVRNEWHKLQGKPNWFSRLLIWLIADPLSSRDEYYAQLHGSQELAQQGWEPPTSATSIADAYEKAVRSLGEQAAKKLMLPKSGLWEEPFDRLGLARTCSESNTSSRANDGVDESGRATGWSPSITVHLGTDAHLLHQRQGTAREGSPGCARGHPEGRAFLTLSIQGQSGPPDRRLFPLPDKEAPCGRTALGSLLLSRSAACFCGAAL
jgi:hypothetical protein